MWTRLFICVVMRCLLFFFFKQKTAYEMRISDWSSDVCSSDLNPYGLTDEGIEQRFQARHDAALARINGLLTPERLRHQAFVAGMLNWMYFQIGRASCRERVCQYV